MSAVPSPLDLLELSIDVRLHDLWGEANDVKTWDLETVAAFLRAAYGKGYQDALMEPNRGELLVENGYKVPPRRESDGDT